MTSEKWFMPAEWEPHERTWMAWPSSGYTLGDTDSDWQEARSTWASVANAIIEFEPVSMLCEEDAIAVAKEYLDPRVEVIPAALNDAWMRDIGPTFVKNEKGEVAGVNWIFNGWGAQAWAKWDKDSAVASLITKQTGKRRIDSQLINEGGGIHVNGSGTVLLTETVQLGEGRNSTWTRQEVEAEIHQKLGTEEAIWIRRGLTRDYDEFGTRGHIDIVACFASETKILFHNQEDPTHPDFSVSHEVKRTLEEHGGFELIPLSAPKILRDEDGFVDYSYINHYLVNGGVILCGFDDENDARAVETLQYVYPERKIVLVDARPLFARGGGIHCITQQQPA
jgi:agmatine deiminase